MTAIPSHAYADFLARKTQLASSGGVSPLWMPDFLFGFQKHLVDWSLARGRAALFADCGLGKTPMQLVWGENVVRHTNKPVLLLTPLGVGGQTVQEAAKFGIECHRSRDGKFPSGAQIVISNYEQLHKFQPGDFAGAACDESGCLKNFEGERTAQVTEFMRTVEYRLLCTATPSPNDYIELGTSSEALGEMGYQDMLSRFFKNDQRGVHANSVWGGGKWRFRGHAETDFWRYICSWARCLRRPSDLGFSDDGYALPPLTAEQHVVKATFARPGSLFDTPAETPDEQREERRRTLKERCDKAAGLVAGTGKPAVMWCHLNPEGDLLTRLVPGAVQVSGSDSDDRKEEVFQAFKDGQIRVLVTKPTIAGYGLNWQHCAHMTLFPSHSYEQYYQSVRRFWRFGQTEPVRVDMVTSEGEAKVLVNLLRKEEQAEVLYTRLVAQMNNSLRIEKRGGYTKQMEVPTWLQ